MIKIVYHNSISGNDLLIKDMVTGLIDLKRVEELKEQMGMDIFKLLFDRYMDEAEKMIADLSKPSAKNQDVTVLIQEIHKVAGSSATFGATEMHKVLNQLEMLGKESDAHTVISRLGELNQIWDASKKSYQDQGLLNA